MNVSLQENLKKLMCKHGNLSVSDLSKATGIPQPTLYQLYTGVTENPRKKTCEALANYFSVTVNQLIGKETLPNYLPEKTKLELGLHTAPVLTWNDLCCWPDHIHLASQKEIFIEKKANKSVFAVNMHDQSMEPLFPQGCLLIFDAEKTAQDNDCAIILLHETNQFIFEKIQKKDDAICSNAINPAFNNKKTLAPEDKILATLLEARLIF